MDPVSAFATIVGLLSNWVAHREANESKSFDEFMAWLSETRHDELRSMLEANTSTTVGIKALLNDNHQQVIERFRALDLALARFASGFDPSIRGISEASHAESVLSAQAVALLTEFYDSGASKVLFLDNAFEGTKNLLLLDGNGELSIADPRFVQDDLETLAGLCFLGVEFNGQGQPIYMLRRAGADAVESWRPSKTKEGAA